MKSYLKFYILFAVSVCVISLLIGKEIAFCSTFIDEKKIEEALSYISKDNRTAKDLAKAKNILQSIKEGEPFYQAKFYLSAINMLEKDYNTAKLNLAMAKNYFESSKNITSGESYIVLYLMNFYGLTGVKNKPLALKYLEEAISLGSRNGLLLKADMYNIGDYYERDYDKSLYFFEKALDGDKARDFILGKAYLDPKGILYNAEKGNELLKKACANGNKQACGRIKKNYATGMKTLPNGNNIKDDLADIDSLLRMARE